MWVRPLLMCSLLFCGPLAWSAAAGEQRDSQPRDVPSLMNMMAKVASREDRFTETKTVAVLTKPLVLKGTLAYTRPDRVEKHVLQPYEEHLVVQGDHLTLSNQEGTKRIAVKSHPLIWSFVEAIRASLAGEVAVLRQLYHIKFQGTEAGWTLTLRPLDRQAAEHLTSITLTGHGDHLNTVDIREAGGDRSLMQIHGPTS